MFIAPNARFLDEENQSRPKGHRLQPDLSRRQLESSTALWTLSALALAACGGGGGGGGPAVNDPTSPGGTGTTPPLPAIEATDETGSILVSEGDIAESFIGLGGDDEIDAGGGDDVVSAGGGDDVVDGGKGNDTIDGGEGSDTLTGGEGADTFVFSQSRESEGDVITDFDREEGDQITLPEYVETIRVEQRPSEGSTTPQVQGGTRGFDDGLAVGGRTTGIDTYIFVNEEREVPLVILQGFDAWGGEGADEFIYIGGSDTTANSGIVTVDIHDYDASEGDKLIIDADLLNDNTVHTWYRSSGNHKGYTLYLNSTATSVSKSAFRIVTTDGSLTASDFAVYSDTDTDFNNPLTVVEWV